MREFGIVKKKNADRGFFFITPTVPVPALHGANLYGHISQVQNLAFINIHEGSKVSFEVFESTRNPGKLEARLIKLEPTP